MRRTLMDELVVWKESLAWLQQAGLIYKVRRVSKPHVSIAPSA